MESYVKLSVANFKLQKDVEPFLLYRARIFLEGLRNRWSAGGDLNRRSPDYEPRIFVIFRLLNDVVVVIEIL
jgi:hypothetical protein